MLVLFVIFVGVLGAYAVLVLTGLAVFAELDENDDPSDTPDLPTSWSLRHATAREGMRITREKIPAKIEAMLLSDPNTNLPRALRPA